MEIEEKTEGDVTTLFLKGRMLGGDADKLLREKVEGLVEAGRVNIILDMAGVPDIDSLCLGEILRSQMTSDRAGGKLRLVNPNERIRVLLTRTRFTWLEEGGPSDDVH
jgi:anti-sigma B factor antagonist